RTGGRFVRRRGPERRPRLLAGRLPRLLDLRRRAGRDTPAGRDGYLAAEALRRAARAVRAGLLVPSAARAAACEGTDLRRRHARALPQPERTPAVRLPDRGLADPLRRPARAAPHLRAALQRGRQRLPPRPPRPDVCARPGIDQARPDPRLRRRPDLPTSLLRVARQDAER